MLPLYEAKMIHHFDHRWATYEGSDARDVTLEEKQDPNFVAMPRYWVPDSEIDDRLEVRWDRKWFLGWRDICRSTDVRTTVGGALPRYGVGDKFLLANPEEGPLLGALLTSIVFDYIARQKIGGTSFKYFTMKQLPVLEPSSLPSRGPVSPCTREGQSSVLLELAYTSWDMKPFAEQLEDHGPPFRWDPQRRALLRAELDSAFFHLYGVNRDDTDYILETFPIVKRKDIAKYGEYRTKRLILEVYDRMADAICTGEPYQTILDPPAGQGPRHPAKETA